MENQGIHEKKDVCIHISYLMLPLLSLINVKGFMIDVLLVQ